MPEFDPHRSGNLTALFDNSRKIPPAETLEHIRHDYYVAATMRGSDDPAIGGLRINMSGRTDMDMPDNSTSKKKRDRENFMLALMISNMTIRQMEDRLAKQYGENYAENLAAEHLAEDTYKRLMSIEDKTERRRQIAFELNKGIEDGSIVTEKIYGNSDFKDWLGAHRENRQLKLEASQNNYDSDSKLDLDAEATVNEKNAEESHKNTQNTSLEVGFDAILGK